jgi:hypothetical protein
MQPSLCVMHFSRLLGVGTGMGMTGEGAWRSIFIFRRLPFQFVASGAYRPFHNAFHT